MPPFNQKFFFTKIKNNTLLQKNLAIFDWQRIYFFAVTPTFFIQFSIPIPVLKSELLCGSNGMLHLKIGPVIKELRMVKVKVPLSMSHTVVMTTDNSPTTLSQLHFTLKVISQFLWRVK